MCKWNMKALLDGTEGYDRKLDIEAVQRSQDEFMRSEDIYDGVIYCYCMAKFRDKALCYRSC